MPILPAVRNAARVAAAQMLATKLPRYKHVFDNAAALHILECRILKILGATTLDYTDWAFGVDIVMPNGQTITVPQNYKLSPVEDAINEFLEYLALKYCLHYGFLVTYCIVNKSGGAQRKGKPSDTFFQLAEDVGLLTNQNWPSRDVFLKDEGMAALLHDTKCP